MRKISYIILFLSISWYGFGQSLDSFISTVEKNNPRIITLQKWLAAEEIKAKTGIFPENPDVSYNYLWGSPDVIGNQQEIEITQSFKLPGYYTSKSTVQKLEYKQKQVLAEKEKREVLHTARSAYFNLVWLYKQENLLKSQRENAETLITLVTEGYEKGEMSKPDLDKIRFYTTGIQAEWQVLQSQIERQKQLLSQLSGGFIIDGFEFGYPLNWEPPVLDSLLAHLSESYPDLIVARLSLQQSENEIKYQRMNSLPSIEAGYKSENILGQRLQGFHLGINIPLWQNANSIEYAKMRTEWYMLDISRLENELKVQVSALINEVMTLRELNKQMLLMQNETNLNESSLKLLMHGQISFNEYYFDADLMRTMQTKFLKSENAYYELLSKLKTFE